MTRLNNKKSGLTLLVLSLLVALPLVAKEEIDAEKLEVINSDQTPIPLQEIQTFAEVFTRIKQGYVEQVSDEELLDYAIEGMLSGLDPHSVYLRDERFTELKEDTSGRFGGLGIEVMMEGGVVKVIAPIDDTPAAKADIQSGDLIVRIDGTPVMGMTLNEATDMMRGEPDTPITLTVLRGEDNNPFKVTLIRDLIRVKTVRSKRLTNDIGYLRITQFQETTAELFRKEIEKLNAEKQLLGLVLDLRNNPGGLLNSAVTITDAFVEQGDLVSIKGRHKDSEQIYKATPGDVINGSPIVAIINGGSASASEIVAGALQDHKRALIIGTESFGKGSVQSVVDINEKIGIKLTTARYYTPSGRSIQASGITPDIVIEQRQFKDTDKKWKRLKENDLPGHLSNEVTEKKQPEEAENTGDKKIEDYQLNEALNFLKGMTMYHHYRTTNDKNKS